MKDNPRYFKVKQAIDGFWKENHYPPTIRYLGERAGIPSTSVVVYYLKRIPDIRITDGRIIPAWVDDVFESAQTVPRDKK